MRVRRDTLQQTTHPILTSKVIITHTLSSVDRWNAQLSALPRRAVLLADRRDHPQAGDRRVPDLVNA